MAPFGPVPVGAAGSLRVGGGPSMEKPKLLTEVQLAEIAPA